MRVDLSKPVEPIRKTIQHHSFGSCTLLIRPMDIELQMEIDAAEMLAYFNSKDFVVAEREKYLARARLMVVGWEGVEDADGNPIAYSWPTLKRISGVFPEFSRCVAEAVQGAAMGLSEDDRKNSPAPPADGAPAAEQNTQSSASGPDSGGGSN